ncbi:ETS-related transcription factor Elf-2 isoform X1 [Sceloporus undulatus]|uniref:ETS-related transcription factor Elf-2 isoform X1 n=2 Tax=Sceloporus undulatus TaxID=8520 RepID=UPI001C4B7DB9|nr:ETS-related transcription factor Elf-2 isoform X1 [Sceloporus undulatus]
MTSAVVDSGGSGLEFDSNGVQVQSKENEPVSEYPAVIVEPVPSARVEQGYAAQIFVYDDETFLLQDVAEEQEIETETVKTVEASVHGSNVHCSDKTIEAAEALLHMESPTCLRDARTPVEVLVPPCVSTPEFIHAAMRPDVITETVVEVSTEESEPMDTSPIPASPEMQEPLKKKKAGRKPKTQVPSAITSASPDLGIKKKPREGKGNTTYLWEFLLDLLQDKNTCPRYIKWTQREKGIFKLVDSKAVSKLWGKHKNKPDMNYETMGRALRYYYQRGILAKVEGQRLVYQFKEMPKNIVVIDDKSECSSEDLSIPTDEKSLERVSLSAENLLKAATSARAGKNASQLNCTGTEKPVTRVVNISSSGHEISPCSPPATTVPATPAPRTVRVAMQVPVVMTSLGQKISTVAVQSVNTGSPLMTTTSPTTAATPKVVIQTIPTVMPASAENGEKITVQPTKIITIPATQLAQCQLQAKTGLPGTGSINIVGTPLAVRALTPVSIAHGTPVMRLSMPAQQAGSHTPPRVISAVIKGPEVKSEATALKQEGEIKTLQLVQEEKPADGTKTVTHVVVVSTPSAIALPVTVKTEGIVTCEK